MNRIAATAGLLPPVPDSADVHEGDAVVGVPETNASGDGVRRAVERQRAAGLDRLTPGQTGWADRLAHPLAVHDAVQPGEPVPYLDADETYRRPVVTDGLTFDGAMAAELERAAELVDADGLQAAVPGPYTLSRLADDAHYGDPEEFLAALEAFLVREIRAFPEVETLSIHEPALIAPPPADGEDARAADAIDGVVRAADAETVVHVPGGAMTEKVHAHLLDAEMDAVGYDFARESSANLALINEYGTADDVALALVDGRNPTVETPELVHQRVEWFLDNTPPVVDFGAIHVTTNTDLRALSWDAAGRKLDALGEAVTFELAD